MSRMLKLGIFIFQSSQVGSELRSRIRFLFFLFLSFSLSFLLPFCVWEVGWLVGRAFIRILEFYYLYANKEAELLTPRRPPLAVDEKSLPTLFRALAQSLQLPLVLVPPLKSPCHLVLNNIFFLTYKENIISS